MSVTFPSCCHQQASLFPAAAAAALAHEFLQAANLLTELIPSPPLKRSQPSSSYQVRMPLPKSLGWVHAKELLSCSIRLLLACHLRCMARLSSDLSNPHPVKNAFSHALCRGSQECRQ